MRYWEMAAGLVGLVLIGGPTAAAGFDNTLQITGISEQNILVIDQSSGGGHVARIELKDGLTEGTRQDTWYDANLLGPLENLAPNKISQTGFSQTLALQIDGQSNLFAAIQTGARNAIEATISGQLNQAAILQAGEGNSASFTQVGQQNSVVIRQGM